MSFISDQEKSIINVSALINGLEQKNKNLLYYNNWNNPQNFDNFSGKNQQIQVIRYNVVLLCQQNS